VPPFHVRPDFLINSDIVVQVFSHSWQLDALPYIGTPSSNGFACMASQRVIVNLSSFWPFFPFQDFRRVFSRSNFSWGSHTSIFSESSTSPRKDIVVTGPSFFLGSMGVSVSLHAASMELVFLGHSCVLGAPVIMKSWT